MRWYDYMDAKTKIVDLDKLTNSVRGTTLPLNKKEHNMPYVAIEGVNLVGKSTAVEYIKTHCKYSGLISTYHEPDENTVLGKFIRENVSNSKIIKDPHVRNALYLLGIKENALTSERNKKLHLTSRSILSNIAYSDLSIKQVLDMIKALEVRIPDYIILITASKKLIKKRYKKSKYKDVIESQGVKHILDIQEKMIAIVNELVEKCWLDPMCYCQVEADNENVNNIILTAFKDGLDYLGYSFK